MINNYPVTKFSSEANIAESGQLSGAIDLYDTMLCGVQSPSAITGTEMTFIIY